MPRVKAFLVLWAMLLPACDTGPRFLEGPRIESLSDGRAPLAALLSFESEGSVTTEVEVVDGERRIELSFAADRDPGAGLPLVGFAPGRSHRVLVTIRDAEGRTATAALEVEAPRLPSPLSGLAPIVVTRATADRMEPGTTLLSPRRARLAEEPPDPLLLIDASGTVVWLYRPDAPIDDFEVLESGHLLILTEDFRLSELDWLGREIRSWYAAGRTDGAGRGMAVAAEALHHDVDELPNGNLLALATEIRELEDRPAGETDPGAPVRHRRVVGDVIVEIERDTGAVVWSWHALDHLDPTRLEPGPHEGHRERRGLPDTADRSHATGIAYDPGDESLILSLADRGAVLKIDRATSQILWIFGEPGDWGELSGRTFQLAASDRWPSRPQAAQPTPDGTLLVFDGGGPPGRALAPPTEPPPARYARAAEFLLDHRMAAAGQLWGSDSPGPDAVAGTAPGDVARLPRTGNILVTYGSLLDPVSTTDPQAGTWTRLREYTHESPPELVWEVVIRNPDGAATPGWTTSHALRLPTLRP